MAFQYTSGDPSHLVGGGNASMADIQGEFNDIKTFLNARIAAIPTLVSSLPVGPVDAQEIYYLADAANGVVWHLRYRAASASTYKWEFVGGAQLIDEIATEESGTSGTYGALTTPGPSITVPLAGDYDVTITARITAATGTYGYMSYAIGATAASDADALQLYGTTTTASYLGRRTRRKTGLAAATALVARYKATGGVNTFWAYRGMQVTPVRVG